AELSGKADADGKRAGVEALARLRGEGVNQAIARTAETVPEAVVCDLVQSLAARRAREMAPVLVGFAKSDKATVRTEALKALGEVGDKAVCRELIPMLPGASGSDRSRAEDALVAICRREGTAEPLLEATAKATGKQRVSLLSVLGKVGGEEARAVLVAAVKDDDADSRLAAVRALSGWDDASPLDALLAAATDSEDLRVRVLACRGIATLAGKAGRRSQGEMAGILGHAIAVAPRAEEKRTLLGALRTVRARRALEVASAHLGDPEVVDQAALATVDVAESIGVRTPALANAALERVIARCSDPTVAARATSLLGMTGSSGNLAIGGKATSPDGLNKDGAAHGDQAAIDGNPATYWDEENDKKLYRLRVEMLEEAKVNRIKIVAWVHHQFSPRDFDILCDGKVVKSVKDAQYKGRDLEVRIPPTLCRAVELSITGYYPQSPAVRELEIYGMTDKPEGAPTPKPEGVADGLYETGKSLAYARDGRTLWRLNADPKEGKPYVHPLRLPNGGVLTDLRPADHVWHRALWFSWKYINGVNYWEEDKKTGLSDGRTTLCSSTTKTGKDGSAVCEQVLEYHKPDGPVLLSERRRITFSAAAADGSYRIDWTATFTAGDTEVELDRTPLPHEPKGASHGGYAGFSARLGHNVVAGAFVNSEGGKGQEGTHGKAARWVDYTGKDGGITILDHPRNPRHPAPWYVAAGMPYFSPALLFRESLTLGAGQKMTLRYRVVVHGPSPGTGWLENEWKQFAAE
ncbi:MAG: hypothetical protein HN849_31215, partial [Victivallales bacterium]|nr:hypothetical protein [Victivallales bacterium]